MNRLFATSAPRLPCEAQMHWRQLWLSQVEVLTQPHLCRQYRHLLLLLPFLRAQQWQCEIALRLLLLEKTATRKRSSILCSLHILVISQTDTNGQPVLLPMANRFSLFYKELLANQQTCFASAPTFTNTKTLAWKRMISSMHSWQLVRQLRTTKHWHEDAIQDVKVSL